MSLTIDILGQRELEQKLQKWVKRAQVRVIRSALSAAANPVLAEARRRAPRDSGALIESLATTRAKKVVSYRRNGMIMALIGPNADYTQEHKGRIRRPAKYARVVEYRTPFLRPAFDGTEKESLRIFEKKLRERMEKEAEKL